MLATLQLIFVQCSSSSSRNNYTCLGKRIYLHDDEANSKSCQQFLSRHKKIVSLSLYGVRCGAWCVWYGTLQLASKLAGAAYEASEGR